MAYKASGVDADGLFARLQDLVGFMSGQLMTIFIFGVCCFSLKLKPREQGQETL
jgi:hypothetical protein